LLQSIREKKALTEEIAADLKQALQDFKDLWKEKYEGATPSAAATGAAGQPAGAGV